MEDENEAEFMNSHFLYLTTKNYQKMTVWFMLITAFCAFRAAMPLTVAIAYFQVICRFLQFIAAVCKKRHFAWACYMLATIINIILFLAVMVDQSHIIAFY